MYVALGVHFSYCLDMDHTSLVDNVFFRILIIIGVTLILQMASRVVIERLIRRAVRPHRYESRVDERKREDTLINVTQTTAAAAFWIAATCAILSTIGINIASLATGAGFISVIIGFGAQSTIKDILAGVFILLGNQYRVGDIVTLSGGPVGVNGATGTVEEISLRTTKLRNLDGTLNIIRNGDPSIITNRTFKFANVIVDISVPLENDIDKVQKIMDKVGKDMAKDIKWEAKIIDPIQFMRIDDLTDSKALIKAIGKVKPAAQWDIAGEYRRRIISDFHTHDIKLGL